MCVYQLIYYKNFNVLIVNVEKNHKTLDKGDFLLYLCSVFY